MKGRGRGNPGRGIPSPGGRGHRGADEAPPRASPLGGGARGGLLVARFDPLAAARSKGGDADPTQDPATPSAPSAAPAAARRKRKKSEAEALSQGAYDGLAKVNPLFARVFRGGPQRAASFLPVGEDEGKEVVFEEPPPVPESAGGDSWLSSLGAEAPGSAEGEAAVVAETLPARTAEPASAVDWLTSIGAAKGKASGMPAAEQAVVAAGLAAGELSPAAAAVVGKALDIPPFWRTAPKEELERELRRNRAPLLHHMKRLAKDARRSNKQKGRPTMRRVGGSGDRL